MQVNFWEATARDPSERYPGLVINEPIELEVLDPEFEIMGEEEFDDLLVLVTGSRPQGRFSGQPS